MKSFKITILAALMVSAVAPMQAGFAQTLKAAAQDKYARVAACVAAGAAVGITAVVLVAQNKKAKKKTAAPKKASSNKNSLLQRIKPYVMQPVVTFGLFAAAIAALAYWNK